MSDEEIETEDVETPLLRRLRATKSQRYIKLNWSRLKVMMLRAGTDRSTRLLMVLVLLEKLDQVQADGGWIKLRGHLLEDLGLSSTDFSNVITRLEKRGVIQARRRPGKRPLIKLRV